MFFFHGSPTQVLTSGNDSAATTEAFEVIFGGAGNDDLSSAHETSILVGGTGDDIYRPSYNGLSIIIETGGTNDTFIDPLNSPGAGTDYRIYYITDGDDVYVDIIHRTTNDGVRIPLTIDNADARIDFFVVGEVFNAVLSEHPEIGETISWATFWTQLGVLFPPNLPPNPFFRGEFTLSQIHGPSTSIIRDFYADLKTASGDIENLAGTAGNNTITGDAGFNYLLGYAGNDTIDGAGGDDEISGGLGDDDLTGGSGDDVVLGDEGDDTYYATANDGNDRYLDIVGFDTYSAAGLTETINIDLAQGTASGAQIGEDVLLGIDGVIGSQGADTIVGNAFFNILEGKGGDDFIDGGKGIDFIEGGEGNDLVFGGNGDDLIFGDAGIDQLYGGDGNDSISGGTGNDRLIGNAGNDVLSGGDGDDLLKGRDGDDTLSGDGGNDVLFADGGLDTLNGGTGNDLLYGGRDNDLLNGDEDNDRLRGNLGNDVLNAGAGDDFLFGGGGADILSGQAGNDFLNGDNHADRLDGGAGADILRGNLAGGVGDGDVDTFVFNTGYDVDRVRDFEDGFDLIDLKGFGFVDTATAMAFAQQTGWGAVKFDFGGGDILYVENMTLGVNFTDADILI